MEIVEVSAKEYGRIVGKDIPIFCRYEFLELNKDKVNKVHYLIGKDKKNRIALAIGEKNNEWKAPYSAPFANIILLRKDIPMDYIWEFVNKLNQYVKEHEGRVINIYLPAGVYEPQNNVRIMNALLGNGYRIEFQDVNYSFDLKSFDMEVYKSIMYCNARRNLRIALNSELEFVKCESDEQKEEAYEIIRINRENRGFPLRMTKKQLMDTIKIVEHDFFLVKKDNRTIASAVVYRLTNKVAQVVYWGDISNVKEYKAINFISYKLVEYYKKLDFEILDIGISTDEGKPNYGLCSFKESLGCIPSAKFRVQIEL